MNCDRQRFKLFNGFAAKCGMVCGVVMWCGMCTTTPHIPHHTTTPHITHCTTPHHHHHIGYTKPHYILRDHTTTPPHHYTTTPPHYTTTPPHYTTTPHHHTTTPHHHTTTLHHHTTTLPHYTTQQHKNLLHTHPCQRW